MDETTRLVIAVDSTQVKHATEALKALGYQASTVEVTADRLSKAVANAGSAMSSNVRVGVSSMKALADEAKRAQAEMEKLARTNFGSSVISVDVSQIRNAADELRTMGFTPVVVDVEARVVGIESVRELQGAVQDLGTTRTVNIEVPTTQMLAATNILRNLGFQAIATAGQVSRLTGAVQQAFERLSLPKITVPLLDEGKFRSQWAALGQAGVDAQERIQAAISGTNSAIQNQARLITSQPAIPKLTNQPSPVLVTPRPRSPEEVARRQEAVRNLQLHNDTIGLEDQPNVLDLNFARASRNVPTNWKEFRNAFFAEARKEVIHQGTPAKEAAREALRSLKNEFLTPPEVAEEFIPVDLIRQGAGRRIFDSAPNKVVSLDRARFDHRESTLHGAGIAWKDFRNTFFNEARKDIIDQGAPESEATRQAILGLKDEWINTPRKNVPADLILPPNQHTPWRFGDGGKVTSIADRRILQEIDERFPSIREEKESGSTPDPKFLARVKTMDAVIDEFEKSVRKGEWIVEDPQERKNFRIDRSELLRGEQFRPLREGFSRGLIDASDVFDAVDRATQVGDVRSSTLPPGQRFKINPQEPLNELEFARRQREFLDKDGINGLTGEHVKLGDILPKAKFRPTESRFGFDKNSSIADVFAMLEDDFLASDDERIFQGARLDKDRVLKGKQFADLRRQLKSGEITPDTAFETLAGSLDRDELFTKDFAAAKNNFKAVSTDINSVGAAADRAEAQVQQLDVALEKAARPRDAKGRFLPRGAVAEKAPEAQVETLNTAIGRVDDVARSSTTQAVNSFNNLSNAAAAAAKQVSSLNNQLGAGKAAGVSFGNLGTFGGAAAGGAGGGGRVPPPPPRPPAPPPPPNPPPPPLPPGGQIPQGATNATTQALHNQSKALNQNNQHHATHWKSLRKTAFEQQQLAYQLHDFTVQVVGGQSPLLALVQQGSQLAGTFGGIRPAIAAVLGMITPMVAVVGALGVAVGAVALAMARVESSSRTFATLQVQLEGTGRAGAFTTAQLKEMVKQLQEMPNVTKDLAVGIIGEFSRTAGLGVDMFAQLGALAVDYARVTGKDIPEATKELANAFIDPVRGAEQLEKALGRISAEDLSKIRDAMDLGDRPKAQIILIEALETAIGGLNTRGLTPLQTSVNELGNAWDRLMRTFDDSQGLKTALGLVAKLIEGVTWLVENGPKVAIGNPSSSLGLTSSPLLQGPTTIAGLGVQAAERLFGRTPSTGGATGSFGEPDKQVGATGSFGAAKRTTGPGATGVVDEEIKRAMKLGEQYVGLGDQIEKLRDKRKVLVTGMNQAIEKYGKESAAAKQLRESVAGIDDKIKSLGKRQRGSNKDAERIADLDLKDQINAIKDAFAQERSELSLQDKFLQTSYNLGETSLRTFFDRKVELIKQGTINQVKALDDEIAATKNRLATTKDPVRAEALEDRLKDLNREKDLVANSERSDIRAVNDTARASFEQLTDQVQNYRIELLRMQGDEAAAAELQTELAIKRAKVLATQAAGSPQVGNVNVAAMQRELQLNQLLNSAKREQQFIVEGLGITEDRVSRMIQNGTITEVESYAVLARARAAAIPELEAIVQAQEEVAKSRPKDYELQIDTQRAREELESLKDALDPLGQKFQDAFKDQTGNFLFDLVSGKAKPLDAIKNLFNGVGDIITREISNSFSDQLFGKGGFFEGAGGFLSKNMFGQNKPTIDTAPAQTSLNSFTNAGLNPAIAALQQFTLAVQNASGKAVPVADGTGATGDFARFDRGQVDAADASKKATRASEDFSDASMQAAQSVIAMAQSAARGGNALGLLPQIISALQSAGVGGSGGPAGFISSILGSVFSGGADFATGTGTASGIPDFMRGGRALGGPVQSNSMYRVNELGGPELLTVGNKQYLLTNDQSGEVTPADKNDSGGSTVVHVSVAMPPGGTRETAMQWGTNAGRAITRASRRNG